jgi:hypothetical protein
MTRRGAALENIEGDHAAGAGGRAGGQRWAVRGGQAFGLPNDDDAFCATIGIGITAYKMSERGVVTHIDDGAGIVGLDHQCLGVAIEDLLRYAIDRAVDGIASFYGERKRKNKHGLFLHSGRLL